MTKNSVLSVISLSMSFVSLVCVGFIFYSGCISDKSGEHNMGEGFTSRLFSESDPGVKDFSDDLIRSHISSVRNILDAELDSLESKDYGGGLDSTTEREVKEKLSRDDAMLFMKKNGDGDRRIPDDKP